MLSVEAMNVASVLLDHAVDNCLDYHIPEDLIGKLHPGMRVKVPVKKSLREATVLEIKAHSLFYPLHPICEILSEKPFGALDGPLLLLPLAQSLAVHPPSLRSQNDQAKRAVFYSIHPLPP
jgi:primosomal protein N'